MPVKLELKLEEDKDFIKQIKSIVVDMIHDMLRHDDKSQSLLASAIDRYFSWNHTSIESFVKSVVYDAIASAFGDDSTLPIETKVNSVITSLLREAVITVVSDKLKNIKIIGIDDATKVDDEASQ